jgi:phosphohistidine swiveling domain-containing protein
VCSAASATGRGIDPRRGERRAADLRQAIVLLERLTIDDYDLIFRCAGIVTERRDAQLSHLAIACRELGIPYIAGIADARALLHGRSLEVDGGEGSVRVLAEGEPEAFDGPARDVPPGNDARASVAQDAADPNTGLHAEGDADRIERLILELLPYCDDEQALERKLSRVLEGRSLVGEAASFTEEEAAVIRECLGGFDPTADAVARLVSRAGARVG